MANFLIILLITFINLIPKSTSQPTYLYSICPNTTLFDSKSKYHTNLNTLFNALASNAPANPAGFYYTSVEVGSTDAVYGLFLCRGDQSTASCHNCVANATWSVANVNCPNVRVGTTWYDECMVRYSNVSFLGIMSETPRFGLVNTQNITGDMSRFMEAVRDVTNDVAVRASKGGPQKKFATGIVRYSSMQTVYGLGQCTPDLSAKDCYECLRYAIGILPTSIGGRIVMPSCNVRYEVYPFFNGAANVSQSLPPRPV